MEACESTHVTSSSRTLRCVSSSTTLSSRTLCEVLGHFEVWSEAPSFTRFCQHDALLRAASWSSVELISDSGLSNAPPPGPESAILQLNQPKNWLHTPNERPEHAQIPAMVLQMPRG